jgi:polyketide synthase Type III
VTHVLEAPLVAPSRTRVETARIASVATSATPDSYTQHELLELFGITSSRVRGVFLNGAIERRHLVLPPPGPDGRPRLESQGELLEKHKTVGIALAAEALSSCLASAGAAPSDVAHLCCVSSTGFLTPGFSAYLIKELDLRRETSRLDVVGMGCNAGLNALGVVAAWAASHPGELAIMICIEICSAAYVFDGTMRTSVVNSLFGDGVAATAVVAGGSSPSGPELLGFESQIIPDAIGAMRFDWDDEHGKFSFFLDPEIPYLVGAHAEQSLARLLAAARLRRSDISHWLVHSGGKKVIDAVRVNLGLTRYDVRHTQSILRDYGNLSSASFLFSYERLLQEGVVETGEYGVLMTMGPGSTIEAALIRW